MTSVHESDSLPATACDDDADRQRRRRSIALALALGALAVLFFVVTIVRLGANVAQRAL